MRRRLVSVALVVSVLGGSSLVALGGSAPAGASGPSCTFNGGSFPLVLDTVAGTKIKVQCSGLPPSTSFVQLETSLLLAVDPSASALLTGSVTSLPGLLALIQALPEINPGSLAFPSSNSAGVLSTTYTVPSTQPPDPNATCPPPKEQYNSGLIGCAVAMINLSSFAPVTAASFVIQGKGESGLPPFPTAAVTPNKAAPGATVSVGDAKGATKYWWLSTLAALGSLLGTGPATPTISIRVGKHKVPTNAAVTPASYSGPGPFLKTFTPPKLSGTFTVPPGAGRKKVTVQLLAPVFGILEVNVATTYMTVS
ncbi:MAG TPA: hypothetical protein VN768_02965 [Acidimicrobiales bacterium]|nr:hypothetical protein [Acidimicrobiales bacterium]